MEKTLIQPICIYLPDTEKWVERKVEAEKYFAEQGIDDIYWVNGIYAEGFGVEAARPYQRDVPDTDWRLPCKTVGNYLSLYMVYNIALSHPEWEYIFFIEDDARFVEDWEEKLMDVLEDIPEDFDFLFVGNCCSEGRPTTHIEGDLYEVKYPLCGHASIIAHKALPKLIEGCRDACIPMDVNLFDKVFKDLKVYTILPSLAVQKDTYLPK